MTRIAAIMNLIAAHPDQAFKLSQIVRVLGLSQATCHILLSMLTQAGYLYRTIDKCYTIGPVLITLASNIQQQVSPLSAALQELCLLADDSNIVSALIFKEGDELVLRNRTGLLPYFEHQTTTPVQRAKLLPHRNFFLLSLSEGELGLHLSDKRLGLSPQALCDTRKVLAFGREHGFLMGADIDQVADPTSSLVMEGRRFITALEPETIYQVQFLTAPVYDSQGRVAFGVTTWGAIHPLTGVEVLELGRRLTAACARLSAVFGFNGASTRPPLRRARRHPVPAG